MPVTVRATPARITWGLFRKVSVIPGTTEQAQINPEMAPIQNVHPQRTQNGRFRLPSITLTVRVNRQNTMVLKTAAQTAELLKHEQGHFDLLLLVTRALARDLQGLEADSVQELGERLEQAKESHDGRAQEIDAAYDRETAHSTNKPAQQKWDLAIAQALRNPQASQIMSRPL